MKRRILTILGLLALTGTLVAQSIGTKSYTTGDPSIGTQVPGLSADCDWSTTCSGGVLNSLKDPANLNYCTPPPFDENGVPLAHPHPVTGDLVGYRPTGR